MAEVPSKIGKYPIVSIIAIGGMGTVYKAVHPELKRDVIIKKLSFSGSNSAIKERFKREAQILVDLSSPYIVRMFDYFSEGRSDYIVLEFVNGMSLDKLLKKQVMLSPQISLMILLDACYGLKQAHEKGIVHRDIKPGNILISRRAEIKLADFGIASGEKGHDDIENVSTSKKSSRIKDDTITQAGVTLGTPAYMSPEQLRDSRSVDIRADIYSLGVMLYEMVTGSKPYAGDMSPDTIDKIQKGKYIAPHRIDKSLPKEVCSLIKKMMKPNPKQRFQSVDPIISRIRRYLKRYDTHAIRVNIARAIISPEPVTLKDEEPKNKTVYKVLLTGLIFIAVIVGGTFAWSEGIFHKTILRHWYTPVNITLQVPSTASVDADLPARAFFFVNDNNEIPEVSNSRRVFSASKSKQENSSSILYRIKSVYLRPGDYRIKIVEGPYVWWKNLTVTSDDVFFDLDFLKDAKRTLKVHTKAFDYDTGEDISKSTRYMIYLNGEWVNFNTVNPSSLKTGTAYRFYAVSSGYREEYFGLRLDWYQDELFINTTLKKKNL